MDKTHTKKLKRKVKLAGRKICHGSTEACQTFTNHRPLGKVTKKGTKPKPKAKKSYANIK